MVHTMFGAAELWSLIYTFFLDKAGLPNGQSWKLSRGYRQSGPPGSVCNMNIYSTWTDLIFAHQSGGLCCRRSLYGQWNIDHSCNSLLIQNTNFSAPALGLPVVHFWVLRGTFVVILKLSLRSSADAVNRQSRSKAGGIWLESKSNIFLCSYMWSLQLAVRWNYCLVEGLLEVVNHAPPAVLNPPLIPSGLKWTANI